ncbi:MAG: PilZ domain-containing protein [Pseudomonadota bacterium]
MGPTHMAKRELRRYRRIALDLPVRITINAMDDYEGRLLNISPGDMAIQLDADAATGDAIVVAISGLDIIEGRVARIFPDGFAVSFMLPRKRRELLTEKLMLRANAEHAQGLEDRRRTPRHPEGEKRMICRLPDGSSLIVKVLDRSVDGVSVDSPRKPAIGTAIHMGRMRGVIIRHTPRGFVAVHEPGQTVDGAATHLRAV